jgi:hypothetical protein
MSRHLTVVLIALSIMSCASPSSVLVGDWAGRIAPSHFFYMEIRFTWDGSHVLGTACVQDRSTMTVFRRDVPVSHLRSVVSVSYPRIECPNGQYVGRFDKGQIHLEWACSPNSPPQIQGGYIDLKPGGNLCASAQPISN